MQNFTTVAATLIAEKQASGLPLNLTRFVLANVPGLDHSLPVDQEQTIPPVEQRVRVHEINIETERGFVSDNVVVYSLVLGTSIGDFDFNWIGLIDDSGVSEDDCNLVFVVELPTHTKLKTVGQQQGDSLTRNIQLQFTSAATITGIDVPAAYWQLGGDRIISSGGSLYPSFPVQSGSANLPYTRSIPIMDGSGDELNMPYDSMAADITLGYRRHDESGAPVWVLSWTEVRAYALANGLTDWDGTDASNFTWSNNLSIRNGVLYIPIQSLESGADWRILRANLSDGVILGMDTISTTRIFSAKHFEILINGNALIVESGINNGLSIVELLSGSLDTEVSTEELFSSTHTQAIDWGNNSFCYLSADRDFAAITPSSTVTTSEYVLGRRGFGILFCSTRNYPFQTGVDLGSHGPAAGLFKASSNVVYDDYVVTECELNQSNISLGHGLFTRSQIDSWLLDVAEIGGIK